MLLSADPQKDWLMITELSAQIDFLGFQDSKKKYSNHHKSSTTRKGCM